MFTFGHCPNQGGGVIEAPARKLLPFFHQVLVNFHTKVIIFVCFLVIFFIIVIKIAIMIVI